MTLAAQQRGKQQPAVTPAASEAAAETGAKSASSAAEAASGGASGGGGDGGGAGGRRGRRDSELARLDKMGRRGRRFTQWGAIVGTNLSSDDQLHPTGKFASYIGTHDEFFDDVADKTEDRAAAQARARGDEPAAKRRSRKPNKTTLAVQDAWLALKVEKLCQAARDGRIADLRQSVEVEKLGVEHHWRGSSALHLAVSKLQAVAVYYLLALGADRRAPRSNGLKGNALEMLEAHPGARKHDELHRAWRIVHKIMVEGKLIFSSAKEGDVDYVEFLARDVGLHPALGMRFLDVNARNQHGLAALHFAVMKREAAPSVRSLEAQLAAMKKEDAAEKLKVDALEREDGRRKKIEKQRGGRKPGDGLFAPKGQPAGGDAMVAMAKSNAKQKERARERERMRIQALVPPARRTERQFALVQRSMVALLLRCSADVNAETDHGNTPLDYCGDQEDLALELREIGARDGDAPPPDVTAGDSSAGGVGVRAQNLWGSHHAESRKLRLTSSLRCGNNKEGTPPFSLDDALRAMPLRELKDILVARGIDVERVHTKEQAEAVAKSRVYCLRNHPLSLEHWESKSWFRRQNHDAHVEASILIPSEEAAGVVWDAEADEWNSDDPDGVGGGQAGGYGSGGDEEVSGRNGGETAAGSRLASKKPSRRSSKSKIKVGGLPGSKMASRTGSRRNSTNPRQDMGVGEDGEEVQFTFDLRAAREERHAAENEAEADAIKKAQAKDGKGGGKHDAREAARAAAEAARPRKHFPVRCDVLGMPAPQREDADASFAEIGEGPPLDEWGWPIQDGERGSRPGSRGSSRGSSRPGTAEGRTPRSARGGGGGGGGMTSGFNTARSGQGAGGGFDGRGGERVPTRGARRRRRWSGRRSRWCAPTPRASSTGCRSSRRSGAATGRRRRLPARSCTPTRCGATRRRTPTRWATRSASAARRRRSSPSPSGGCAARRWQAAR
jgi:hypothetical protein